MSAPVPLLPRRARSSLEEHEGVLSEPGHIAGPRPARVSETNASLREDYQTHLPALAEVDSRTKVISQIDAQRLRADMTTQETNTLLYETALFDLRDRYRTWQWLFVGSDIVLGFGGSCVRVWSGSPLAQLWNCLVMYIRA